MASGINAYFSRAAPNNRWRADSSSYTAEINVRMTISVATVYTVRYKTQIRIQTYTRTVQTDARLLNTFEYMICAICYSGT